MHKQPFNQFTPPNHPNWTGKTYRSSQEAFGRQLYLGGPTTRATTRWDVVIVVALLFALGLVCAAL